MEESKYLKQEIFELKLRIYELEKQLENLSSHQKNQSNNLKEEILSGLENVVKNLVEESFNYMLIQNQLEENQSDELEDLEEMADIPQTEIFFQKY